MLPNPDILNEYEHGKFVLSNLAAKRAKQLKEGASPLVQIESNHPLTIALAEIAAGKIKPIMPTAIEAIPPVAEGPLLIDETMPAELGMLLPALDETEVALVSTAALEDHEPELESDVDAEEPVTLSSLVGEEEEEAARPSDDDTLSLSDIEEQESASEEEAEE